MRKRQNGKALPFTKTDYLQFQVQKKLKKNFVFVTPIDYV